jgi:hypothetical protein
VPARHLGRRRLRGRRPAARRAGRPVRSRRRSPGRGQPVAPLAAGALGRGGPRAGRRGATAVVEGAGLPTSADLGGRLDLPALADLVRWARLVLCGDTGVSHLATAWDTPSVTLFGPTSPRLWGPPAAGPHAVLWHGADGASGTAGPAGPEWHGDPHGDSPDPMLLATTVEEVLAAAHGLLPAHVT